MPCLPYNFVSFSSVHFWYWNNKDNNADKTREATKLPDFWTEERLALLAGVGKAVQARLQDALTPLHTRSLGFAPLLHKEWLQRFPECTSNATQLEALINKLGGSSNIINNNRETCQLPWSPKLNRALRDLAASLRRQQEYTMARLMDQWRHLFPGRRDSPDYLMARLEDGNVKLPLVDLPLRPTAEKGEALASETRMAPAVQQQQPAEEGPSCLNARGQMKWSHQGRKHMSCSQCQESSQLTNWLLIGYLGVNNQSEDNQSEAGSSS